MKNIVFSKIWIIGILAIVFAGGFFAWQYFGVPKEKAKTPEKITDETADWQTYTFYNNKYSFKYPPSWYIDEEFKKAISGDNINLGFFAVGEIPPSWEGPGRPTGEGMLVHLSLYDKNFKFSTLGDLSFENWQDTQEKKLPKNYQLVNIGSLQAIKMIFFFDNITNEAIRYIISGENEIIEFIFQNNFNIPPGKPFDRSELNTIENIISTFRFLPPK